MSFKITVTSSPSSSEVSNVATTAPSTALPSSSVKSVVLVNVKIGASFVVVILGSWLTG